MLIFFYFLQVCHSGSGRASEFSDFEDLIPPDAVEELSLVYDHVDDVDLFVGGFLERAQGDSLIGPTFKCIVGDQVLCGKRNKEGENGT